MPERGEPLGRLRTAATTLALAERALADRVREAHAAGHSWADIGGVLGTTRQAAFKRFGSARDPRTGEQMRSVGTEDVGPITERVFALVDQGDYDALRAQMPDDVARVLSRDVVLDLWARVVADTGNLVRCEDTVVEMPGGREVPRDTALGTVVGVTTLVCEAGEWQGRVAVGQDRQVLGLLVVPPGARDLPF
ncbi:hypothetical protein [Nocardioides hwasunensis]|uniref:TetR family transcriptional regulator n=1 Tax=Nocardioides hwasunensis TaxID=397258 RepID=A0ABR8MJ94_9ACTN|nr:hypothetical protein [Nocardioides hwasunensis]MBD3916121.1 hypothetical protein [Nocardioides hwasunensis]